MHEKALNWACIPCFSLVLNAKKIKFLIVRCLDEPDEIKALIIIIKLPSLKVFPSVVILLSQQIRKQKMRKIH